MYSDLILRMTYDIDTCYYFNFRWEDRRADKLVLPFRYVAGIRKAQRRGTSLTAIAMTYQGSISGGDPRAE